jgi:hypothetical protein
MIFGESKINKIQKTLHTKVLLKFMLFGHHIIIKSNQMIRPVPVLQELTVYFSIF